MIKMNLITLGILSLFCFIIQASPITTNTILAPKLNGLQWQALNDLWRNSFYQAYKDLPLDQIDFDIQDTSTQALIDYLQRRFNKYRLVAIQDSYSLVLAYKDEKLVGYTMYHLLDQQAIIHIDHFAIDPNYQGQGIGKTLLEATINSTPGIIALEATINSTPGIIALEATINSTPGIIAVVLTTRIHNKKAQGFYQKQGFYELTNVDGVVFDSRYSILLRKDIII